MPRKALDEFGTQELIDEVKRRVNFAKIPHYTQEEYDALPAADKPKEGDYFVITDDFEEESLKIPSYTQAEYDALPAADKPKTGEYFCISDDNVGYKLYSSTGQNTDGGMTQKSITVLMMEHKNGYAFHNSIAMDDDITSMWTSGEFLDRLADGTYRDLFVGNHVTLNGHKYYIGHNRYWYNTGTSPNICSDEHTLIVPDGCLVSGKMNSTNTTAGAYAGSDFKTGNNDNTTLADIKAIIKADFGAENILTHNEYFVNAMSDGKPSAGAWYNSDIDLMNEHMVYGGKFFETGVTSCLYSIDKTQLKIFADRPDLITNREYWWLRDPVSTIHFALVDRTGIATLTNTSGSFGIRPAFAIKAPTS